MEKKPVSKKQLRRTVLLSALAVLIVVFGGLYAAARTFGRVSLSNLADVFAAFSVKDDSAFPYPVDAGTVVRIVPVGSGIGVLRTDKLDVLTKSGAILQTVKHTYTMPAVDVCGGRILLYDRAGTRYMLLSKTSTLRTGELRKEETEETDEKDETKILTASLAEDGRYAVATTCESAKSLLTVYKSSGEAFFQYKCVSEYITDVAFTNGGVVLTVAGVRDASPYSRLISLSFRKTKPIADFTYNDATLFHVHADANGATACGSSCLAQIRHKTEQLPQVSFGSDTLQFFCEEPGGKTTLVLLTFGNEHESKLRGLRKNGDTAFEADCGEKLKDASRSSAYTAVLTDNTVLSYNNSGSQIGTLHLTQAAQKIALSERMVFVLFNDHIDAFPAAGEHEQPAENG
ncbi:MAG: hypothetical protein IJT44_02025 [Clostridia bacterium]|nr:hypothetical protein [Clostridia bacterium]